MLIYFIFFFLLYKTCRKYKSPVLDFILLFYICASVCGIITHLFVEPNAYCTILSVPFHIVCLYLFIRPFIIYGRYESQRYFILLDNNRFRLLSYVLIGLQIFSILYFAEFVINLLLSGNLAQLRSELLYGNIDLGASVFRTIAGTSSYYYCINILLFFYSLAFRKDNKLFLILLIASSTSRIFHALTYMGRDGILFWILSFVFNYFLFKPYLGEKSKKIANVSFYILGSIAIVIIGAITLSRFSTSDEGVFLSLCSYLGQPLNNFGQLFDKFHEYSGTKAIFPLLYGERGGSGAEAIANAENFYAKYGFYSNIFFSFVGNMYRAWGPIVTLFVSIMYSIIMSNAVKYKKTTMKKLIVLMVASIIVLQNYFYWAYSIRVGNLFIFSIPLFLIFLSGLNGPIKESKRLNILKKKS